MITLDHQEVPADSSIYGSFSLGGSEFALPVDSTKEVVNEPDEYSSIPLAPSYLLGMFNLRGVIVPVVDLRKIFNVPDVDNDREEQNKIAIIEHGDLCIGLLFDATAEVFNNRDVEVCWFESANDTVQDLVVKGVFKMDEGRRIVQILDVYGILKLDKIPRTGKSRLSGQFENKHGVRKQCIAFVIGESQCALDITSIKEIVDIEKIENKILASELCLGAIDIRGNTVPVVNFKKLLGYDDRVSDGTSYQESSRVMVMKVEEELFGLLVDSVENIISYFEGELIPFPILGGNRKNIISGCIPLKDDARNTIVLNHNSLFSNDEISSITKGHSHLFKDKTEDKQKNKKVTLDRKRLITFSLDTRFGLDINDVREVIDFPSDIIKTPNMSPHMCGMANLRGELISVIDTRALYDMKDSAFADNSKVLIFDIEGAKQGLVVDSVDSITPFSEEDLVDMPQIMFSGKNALIGADVKHALIVEDNNSTETICVLDLKSVSSRASQ